MGWRIQPLEDWSNCFRYKDGDLIKKYAAPANLDVNIYAQWSWFNFTSRIKNWDDKTRTIELARPLPDYQRLPWSVTVVFNNEARYFIENGVEDITEPGEWAIDRAAGVIYFLPPDDFSPDELTIPYAPALLDLRLADRIEFSGFTFAQTRFLGDDLHRAGHTGYGAMLNQQGNSYCGEAIRLFRSSHNKICDNKLFHCGANGIYIEQDCRRNEIKNNEIAYAGANGVCLMGNPVSQPRYNIVSDNHIHGCGILLNYIAGVFAGTSDGNTISHNEIHDLPHHAINLASNPYGRNLVEYNKIYRVTRQIHDTGAINSWMDHAADGLPIIPQTQRSGHVIRFNHISDIWGEMPGPDGKMQRWGSRGIYLDDGSSNCFVYGNFVLRCGLGLQVHTGMHNYIENNMFIDCDAAFWICDYCRTMRPGNEWLNGFLAGQRFVNNIIADFNIEKPVLYLLHCFEEDLTLQESDYNCIYSEKGFVNQYQSVNAAETTDQKMSDWISLGFDKNSIFDDPMFIDIKNGDYGLRPESPALQMGFNPLPLKKMGRL